MVTIIPQWDTKNPCFIDESL